MAGTDHPSKSDIQAILKKLRSIPSNKQCFDCGAANPTWASVTHGVFLCIDCSAVHRSLGVHVSFIRSTQLDTNWTWIQLRAMQVGGNSNANAFYRQHGCNTNDSQQKYHSRAAQLYKGKLEQLAIHAMKIHGTKIHIDMHEEKAKSPDAKEVDFFKEHTEFAAVSENMTGMTLTQAEPIPVKNGAGNRERAPGVGPNVEAALSVSPTEAAKSDHKSLITAKKNAPRKGGLGAKKGGLGGAKVKTDFSAIERAAEQIDKNAEVASQMAAESAKKEKEDEETRQASMRLAYKDIKVERQKQEEKFKTSDPMKAEQVERLGMGSIGLGNKGISHSALGGMETINQESPSTDLPSSRSALLSGPSLLDRYSVPSRGDYFEEELGVRSSLPRPSQEKSAAWERDASGWGSSRDWGLVKEEEDRFGRTRRAEPTPVASNTDEAQRRFGNAKSISSDSFQGSNDSDSRSALSRFEGSSSISSDDLFGTGGQQNARYASMAPDLGEIREGVRQGVTKVAGRLSSLANGVVSSLQDRYG